MPIKFRCLHCRQLLGISRSRANAVVDCPRCGRSLRVPGLDGQTQKLPDPGTAAKHDSSLLSALSKLSELDGSDTGESSGLARESEAPQQSVVTLDPIEASEPIEVAISQPKPVISAEPDSEIPVAIEESLGELAEFGSPAHEEVSEELLAEMRAAARPQLSPVLMGAAAALLLLFGFIAGRMTATSGTGAAVVSAEESSETEPDETLQPAPNNHTAVDSRVLHGSVTYLDEAGNARPDAGAFVLILPTEAVGKVSWNARSLKRPSDHPDRKAVTSALRSLGADVVFADEAGLFQGVISAMAEVTVVVVSKHVERPEDVNVSQPIEKLLTSYFDSTSHICGRLLVQSKTVAENDKAPDLDFQFRKQN